MANMDNLQETKQQTADINPIHTRVTPQPIKTPLEVQLGLTALIIRYAGRALVKSATDNASPEWMHKYSGANWFRELHAVPLIDKINTRLQNFIPEFYRLFPDNLAERPADIIGELEKHASGRELLNDVRKLHSRWDAGTVADNTTEYFLRNLKQGKPYITVGSEKRIRRAMSEMLFETGYDNALAFGSLCYTSRVQKNIVKDIMSIYSEAVAYEKDKDARAITEDDITSSQNQIIQSTIQNYKSKRALRYTISVAPLLKNVPPLRALQWGEAAIAGWGALWAFDIWGREPTMLESFRSFVNAKLNPLYGVSEPIKSAEIIDMYQQYAYRFAPEQAFRSISINDEDANRMWAKSEKVFVRIAELMNDSYNYKHTTMLDPDTDSPVAPGGKAADFTLPKFIYLLGHGLINARRPEWSMAFVEISNSYDMKAVKEAQRAYRDGASLSDVLAKYPVNLNPNGHINGVSETLALTGLEPKKPAEPLPEAERKTSGRQETQTETKPETKPGASVDAPAPIIDVRAARPQHEARVRSRVQEAAPVI